MSLDGLHVCVSDVEAVFLEVYRLLSCVWPYFCRSLRDLRTKVDLPGRKTVEISSIKVDSIVGVKG